MLYSYKCETCQTNFEISCSVSEYKPKVKCPTCKTLSNRDLVGDCTNNVSSVVRSDDEITIGELALRNRDRFSEDYKTALDKKHNEYKYQEPTKDLPKGMQYVKPTKRPKWY